MQYTPRTLSPRQKGQWHNDTTRACPPTPLPLCTAGRAGLPSCRHLSDRPGRPLIYRLPPSIYVSLGYRVSS